MTEISASPGKGSNAGDGLGLGPGRLRGFGGDVFNPGNGVTPESVDYTTSSSARTDT